MMNSSEPWSDDSPSQIHPTLIFLLSIVVTSTIIGNVLVILAVLFRPNLHSPTGYFVLSLAVSDLIVGLGVMPLNVIFEMYDHIWPFDLTLCDVWHSLDVLASTASIWNLCVIAVDRAVAVTDPLKYPQKMTSYRVAACIALVWAGSSLIAFPAVAWWRQASPELYDRSDRCLFTDDTGYLLFSSLLSFYIPFLLILCAYGRVYMVASKRQRFLMEGRQPLPSNPSVYMRVHRGGAKASVTTLRSPDQPVISPDRRRSLPVTPVGRVPLWPNITRDDAAANALFYQSYYQTLTTPKISASSVTTTPISCASAETNLSRRHRINAINMISRIPRASLTVKLFAKERKAAKTLGIVMGAFIACWLPFFVINVLSGVCGKRCQFINGDWFRMTFTIVTWLGHCNSFLNPIIYTCLNNEFREAFAYVLSGQWTSCGRKYARRRRLTQAYIGVNGHSYSGRGMESE